MRKNKIFQTRNVKVIYGLLTKHFFSTFRSFIILQDSNGAIKNIVRYTFIMLTNTLVLKVYIVLKCCDLNFSHNESYNNFPDLITYEGL